VEYHHLVFTLPAGLHELVGDNARLVYGLLFEAASAAVRQLAADPKHLGAQVGMTAVLHTWGQNLSLHPHLHIMASGGGLSCNPDGEVDVSPCWRSCRPGFFLPVRPLSRLFRGKFLAGLREAMERNDVHWPESLRDAQARQAWLKGLSAHEWVGVQQAADRRAGSRAEVPGAVHLPRGDEQPAAGCRHRGYGDVHVEGLPRRGKQKVMTLPIEEFARRFLQHVLPSGFVRIRHYGCWPTAAAKGNCRCAGSCWRRRRHRRIWRRRLQPAAAPEPHRCRVCGQGVMVVVELLPRQFGEGQGGGRGRCAGRNGQFLA